MAARYTKAGYAFIGSAANAQGGYLHAARAIMGSNVPVIAFSTAYCFGRWSG